jgi:hypothetical protein
VKLMSGRVESTSYTIISRVYRVVFGSRVTTRLIIGSGSCQTLLCNRVGRVDTNPTRMHELPSLTKTAPIRAVLVLKRLKLVSLFLFFSFLFFFFENNRKDKKKKKKHSRN